jgi:hypothetical protein
MHHSKPPYNRADSGERRQCNRSNPGWADVPEFHLRTSSGWMSRRAGRRRNAGDERPDPLRIQSAVGLINLLQLLLRPLLQSSIRCEAILMPHPNQIEIGPLDLIPRRVLPDF